jgi:hypothetical protein
LYLFHGTLREFNMEQVNSHSLIFVFSLKIKVACIRIISVILLMFLPLILIE